MSSEHTPPPQQPPTAAARARPRREGRQRVRPVNPMIAPFIKRAIPPYEMLDEELLAPSSGTPTGFLRRSGWRFAATRRRYGCGGTPAPTSTANAACACPGACAGHRAPLRPAEFTSTRAIPPAASTIGGRCTVFAPAYGSPFVSDAERGRRYGTLADFQNFVKLAYLSPWLHHSGGTVCEPADLPVNKRHLDMLYAHMRSPTSPSWAP